jgi:hypothetical protein
MNLILELEHVGYQFTTDGDQIRYSLAPGNEVDPSIVKPLLAELKAHKQDALEYLRQQEEAAATRRQGISEPPETPSDDSQPLSIAGADVAEIQKGWALLRAQGYFMMHSQALGERIAIVEHDHYRQNVPRGVPVYTFQEVRLLEQGIKDGTVRTIGDLRLLHETKKHLDGVIIK